MKNTCVWTFWTQGSYLGCKKLKLRGAGFSSCPLSTQRCCAVVGSSLQTAVFSLPSHWTRRSWFSVWFVQVKCNFHVSSRLSHFQRKINFLIIWSVRRSLVLRTESGLCHSEILYELMPVEGESYSLYVTLSWLL